MAENDEQAPASEPQPSEPATPEIEPDPRLVEILHRDRNPDDTKNR